MSADEKQKLYDAIGYEENVDDVYPKEVRIQYLDFFTKFNISISCL